MLRGPKKVKRGSKRRFRASGFPEEVQVPWKLQRKGKTILRKRSFTHAAGVAKLKVKFSKTGSFLLRATSGGVSAKKTIRVR